MKSPLCKRRWLYIAMSQHTVHTTIGGPRHLGHQKTLGKNCLGAMEKNRDRGISQKHWLPHIQSDPDVITIAAREPLPQRNARYDSFREIIHHQMQFLRRHCVLKSRTEGAKMPPLRQTPTFAVRFTRMWSPYISKSPNRRCV